VKLPNFFIIGAYKSGTTSLYHYLRQHPDIFMSRIKEPNFFAHEEKAALMRQEGKRFQGIDNMASYLELFSDVSNEKAIGEASPIYLDSPFAAKRIKKTLPDAKLIAILRHPVEAYYSDHNMRIRDNRKLEEGFRERIYNVHNRIQSGEIAGPMYGAQLEIYYDLFEASSIKVYLYEDLIKDSQKLYQNILRFLDVDCAFAVNTATRHNIGSIPKIYKLSVIIKRLNKTAIGENRVFRRALLLLQRANMTEIPPLSAKLKSELTNIFAEDIMKLEKLINRNLCSWLS
jgi:hypothetical protein